MHDHKGLNIRANVAERKLASTAAQSLYGYAGCTVAEQHAHWAVGPVETRLAQINCQGQHCMNVCDGPANNSAAHHFAD